jgi:hypothetical protein
VVVLRALLAIAAVVALASLPCLLLLLISVGDVVDRVTRAVRRTWRRWFTGRGLPWRQRRGLAKLDRTLGVPTTPIPAQPVGPPIEQIAADLRRLGQQRVGIATRSPVWFNAVQKAYDDRLLVACRELDIAEHLFDLDGMDREIERVRIEGEVESAGIVLYRCEAPSS